MLYSCKKCLKTLNRKVDKCPACGGEIKQILFEEYIKEKEITYETFKTLIKRVLRFVCNLLLNFFYFTIFL